MDKRVKQKLIELNSQIKEMQITGNRAGQAALHSQKALLYAMSLDLTAAAREMAQAGALAEKEGRFEEMALAHLIQGRALATNPRQREAAQEMLRISAALYHNLEDYGKEAEASQELAGLALAEGDYSGALEYVDKAVRLFETPESAPELYRLRAACHLFLQDSEAALADIDAALESAQRIDDSALALEIRVERATLQKLRSQGATSDETATLLQEAQQIGHLQATADIRLQRASEFFQVGKYQRALEEAQAARQAARGAGDVGKFVRYLLASLLIADAQENLGDRPSALAALLTCKVYLETHLGAQLGQAMNALLDTLEERWGREGLAETVRTYQQRVQEQGPHQV